MNVEALARELHEAGREAVTLGNVVNKVPGQRFLEWDDLPPEARIGRRMMASHLLVRFDVVRRSDGGQLTDDERALDEIYRSDLADTREDEDVWDEPITWRALFVALCISLAVIFAVDALVRCSS